MRYFINGIILWIGINTQAQTYVSYTPASNTSGVATLTTSLNNRTSVSGTTYIFDDWNNSAKLWTNDGNQIKVENINFNAFDARFSSKISKDSVFNFYNIHKVEVKGRNFQNINNQFYEVIYTFPDDRMVLKEFSVKIKPELDRITSTVVGPGKYVIEDHFYLYSNGNINRFTVKKKNVMELVGSKKSEMVKYAKSHRLSFSKEDDLVNLLQYYDSLK